jgi:hypothetical protein
MDHIDEAAGNPAPLPAWLASTEGPTPVLNDPTTASGRARIFTSQAIMSALVAIVMPIIGVLGGAAC